MPWPPGYATRGAVLAALVVAMACGDAPLAASAVDSSLVEPAEPVADAPIASPPTRAPTAAVPWVTRPMRNAALTLARDAEGIGQLWLERPGEAPEPLPCDVLRGAWGLWLDDIDGDGRAEAIVALHKPARFDAEPANRLHVYGFERGRCVPAWRGTRLAGRFDGIATDPADRGALIAHEWLSPTRRRIARYRWKGFGYEVEHVLWEGPGEPPLALRIALDFGPSPLDSPPVPQTLPDRPRGS